MSAISVRERILNADDLRTTTIIVAEWDCELALRALSDAEVEALMLDAEFQPADGTDGGEMQDDFRTLQARVIVAAALGENGVPLFSEADVPHLAGKSRFTLDRVTATVLQLTGIAPSQIAERRMYLQYVQDLTHMAVRLGMPLGEFLSRVGLAEREMQSREDEPQAGRAQGGAAHQRPIPARDLSSRRDMSRVRAEMIAVQKMTPAEVKQRQEEFLAQYRQLTEKKEMDAAKEAGNGQATAVEAGASS